MSLFKTSASRGGNLAAKIRTFAALTLFSALIACSGGSGGGSGNTDTNSGPLPPVGSRTSPPELSAQGGIDTFGQSRKVLVDGDILYIADGTAGLQVLQMPRIGQPYSLGRLPLLNDGRAYDIVKQDETLYITARSEGVYVIDVSEPASPALIGVIDTPSPASFLTIRGENLYVTATEHLAIYNVADPQNPVQTGLLASDSPLQQIAVSNNIAYVAAYNQGLQIVDLSDESSPTILNTTELDFNAQALILDGGRIVVAGEQSVAILNLSNERTPAISASHTLEGLTDSDASISGLEIDGDLLYVASSVGGVQIIDIEFSSQLLTVESLASPPDNALGLALDGRRLYVADGKSGVVVLDVFATTDQDGDDVVDGADLFPADPDEWEDFDGDGIGNNADTDDDDDGIADSEDAFPLNSLESKDSDGDNIGDNSDLFPNNPGEWEDKDLDGLADNSDEESLLTISGVSSIDTNGQARGVIKHGNLIYVADGSGGVRIFRIDSNAGLSEISNYKIDSADAIDVSARSLALVGSTLYVAYRSQGLHVLDVTDPSNPVRVAQRATKDRATFVTVFDDRLYLSDRNRIQVFDISILTDPVYLGETRAATEYHHLVVENGLAYVAGYYSGLVILDVSDPADIRPVGGAGGEGYAFWAVEKMDNFVFIGGEGSGLRVYDVNNPSKPERVATLELPSEALPKPADQPPFQMKRQGNYLFVADGFSGIQVVNISDPYAPRIETGIALDGYTWDFWIDGYSVAATALKNGVHLLNLGEGLDHDEDGIPNYIDAFPLESR